MALQHRGYIQKLFPGKAQPVQLVCGHDTCHQQCRGGAEAPAYGYPAFTEVNVQPAGGYAAALQHGLVGHIGPVILIGVSSVTAGDAQALTAKLKFQLIMQLPRDAEAVKAGAKVCRAGRYSYFHQSPP